MGLGTVEVRTVPVTGRAVDVKYWTIPDAADPVEGLHEWLTRGRSRHSDPIRTPDLAHEPVILIRPRFGEVAWDPGVAPPPRPKAGGRLKPRGLALA